MIIELSLTMRYFPFVNESDYKKKPYMKYIFFKTVTDEMKLFFGQAM